MNNVSLTSNFWDERMTMGKVNYWVPVCCLSQVRLLLIPHAFVAYPTCVCRSSQVRLLLIPFDFVAHPNVLMLCIQIVIFCSSHFSIWFNHISYIMPKKGYKNLKRKRNKKNNIYKIL